MKVNAAPAVSTTISDCECRYHCVLHASSQFRSSSQVRNLVSKNTKNLLTFINLFVTRRWEKSCSNEQLRYFNTSPTQAFLQTETTILCPIDINKTFLLAGCHRVSLGSILRDKLVPLFYGSCKAMLLARRASSGIELGPLNWTYKSEKDLKIMNFFIIQNSRFHFIRGLYSNMQFSRKFINIYLEKLMKDTVFLI